MPLVFGVCRTASAPTLPHGGSRLNASKPEANPKTSCPKSTNCFRIRSLRAAHQIPLISDTDERITKRRINACHHVFPTEKNTSIRIASQTIAVLNSLAGAKYIKNSREFLLFFYSKDDRMLNILLSLDSGKYLREQR